MIVLRDYQQRDYDAVIVELTKGLDTLLVAPCGYGKSVVIAHLCNNLNGRVLALTHRKELLEQNSALVTEKVTLTPRQRDMSKVQNSRVVISMTQTLERRVKKYGPLCAGYFDYIIIDETHLDYFAFNIDTLTDVMTPQKIGLTATPVLNKRETTIIDGLEYIREKTLASQYDSMVWSTTEQDLIDMGYLVKDYNIQLRPDNFDKLVASSSNPDGFTSESLTQVFGNKASIAKVFEAYQKYCVGKKTLIFNPTTKANLKTYDYFVNNGVPCRIFDSVNSSGEDRDEVVEWFRDTEDAVLLNVGIFNVGFSVDELECIIYNKATKSLSLYLQTAGRGSRISKKILKEQFIFIDLGLNIERHGTWSQYRNWNEYFKEKKWELKKEYDILHIWECDNCGAYNQMGTKMTPEGIVCNICGEKKVQKNTEGKYISGKFTHVNKPSLPTANKILGYIRLQGGDANDAFSLLDKKILELFILNEVTIDDYQRRRDKYHERIRKIYQPIYFAIIKSELKGKRRRLNTQVKKMIEKTDKHYNL